MSRFYRKVSYLLFIGSASTKVASMTSDITREGISLHTRGLWHVDTKFQAQDTDFGEWIALFTLCLAPIVAHLIAGVPEPSMSDTS